MVHTQIAHKYATNIHEWGSFVIESRKDAHNRKRLKTKNLLEEGFKPSTQQAETDQIVITGIRRTITKEQRTCLPDATCQTKT